MPSTPTPTNTTDAAAGQATQSPDERTPESGAMPSITDFLTDGSLAALCSELSRLLGVPIELHDAVGRAIVRRGDSSWAVTPSRLDSAGAVQRVPLMLAGLELGAIVVGSGEPRLANDARERLERALSLLCQTTGEIIQHEVELRHRIKEIAALSHMSSLLVRAAGPERVLNVALDSSLDVLGLDAGSIVLFKEDPEGAFTTLEEDVLLQASRGLSKEWLEYPHPLSKDRVFDRLASEGTIVVSEDIATDPRINIRDKATEEGLGAAIHAGLVFKNRSLGVMRLYSRTPRVFDEWEQRLLASLASQVAVALEQSRLLKFEREEQRVQRQLQLAADVQQRMLPKGIPSIPTLDVAAKYVPSFELGGDFYDFIDLSGHLGIAIGDVVGKGIAAALLMASVRASLRAHAREIYDLDEIVARVNQALCRDMRDNEFASLWYGVIDPARLRLTYCSAGHEPPLIVRVPRHRAPSNADVDELTVGGMVVGIDPSQRYQRAVFDLKPRDVLVAYTDGISDAVNFEGQRFGKNRVRRAILAALAESPEATAQAIVERILWEVRQFAGLTPRNDDRTLVVLRVPDQPGTRK